MKGLFNKKIFQEDTKILEEYNKISKLSNEEIIEKYNSTINGISSEEAKKRLEKNGLNIVEKREKKSWLYFLVDSFNDKFIFILIFLAIINFCLGDKVGSYIIIGIAIVSALIRFFQNYNVYKFNLKLKSQIFSTSYVMRNGKEKEIKVENAVVGDIVTLNAGTLIPADIRILEAEDLFINQSTFTGETVPIEKNAKISENDSDKIFEIKNIGYMGSNVISGKGKGIIINTGFNTYLGKMSKGIDSKKSKTNFELGIDKISNLIMKYMIFVCLAVLVIYGIIRKNYIEAALFALSVAVGITPSMLPMIVNVNLTKGTKALAKKKTLVKNMNSIQNLGAIDVLCTDKTGTLTENQIVLQKYIDVRGNEDMSILEYAYLNSYFGTGIKTLVDKAIISYGNKNNLKKILENYTKIDEIPFDYERKLMSVVVKSKDSKNHYRMLTKGALEEILKVCVNVKNGDEIVPFTDEMQEIIYAIAKNFERQGMQVIALATKRDYSGIDDFSKKDEKDMTFIGFVAFLDPPKKDVKETLKKLKNIGVTTKVITGDNQYATYKICQSVGIENPKVLLGSEMDQMTDEILKQEIETTTIFARMNPMQKERVVRLLRENGHVVGYMGDGVNDAPSLHIADVGISVNTATDIAKEASDIILLKKSLNVIYDGVMEGRKTYGNITKYLKMALSSDFGDVFSIVIASICLPFLPLLPIQMLLQDFLFDLSQIAIPYDNVDKEFLTKPRKWDTKGLSKFMNVMGITSSIIDVIAFALFWFVLDFKQESYFQTAWFIECLISETTIIYYIRTAKRPFIDSNPDIHLVLGTLGTIIGTILTPILLHNIKSFNFEIMPPKFYLIVILLIVLYSMLVEIVKKIYIKKNGEWL